MRKEVEQCRKGDAPYMIDFLSIEECQYLDYKLFDTPTTSTSGRVQIVCALISLRQRMINRKTKHLVGILLVSI